MALKNTWIGYFDRSYEQAKEAILNRLGITTPELSDHTESNPLITVVDIFLGISELLHYYIDNAAREVFLHSARQYKSAQKIAKLFNYRLKGYSASSVTVKFSIENADTVVVPIPANTEIRAGEISYLTSASAEIPIGDLFCEVVAVQKTAANTTYTSTGDPDQTIELPSNTVDKSVTVTVNSVQYTFVSDLYLSTSTNTHFTTEITKDRKMQIVFGDGTNGIIPPLNANVAVSYYTCKGAEGNVASGEIDTIIGSVGVNETVSVTNESYATGGSGLETLSRLKRTIPASIRTLNRAVTPSDFRDIAEGHSGVAQAYPVYECGAAVDVFIVPTGLGGATQVLMDEVRDLFYHETKLILMDVIIKPAGRISAKIVAKVTVLDVYNQAQTTQKVKDNLSSFLSSTNQEISGSVYIGDIYQVIENTEGVSHCQVELLSTIPEATIVTGTTVLDWTRTLLPASDEQIRWTIKFIGNNNYELRRENVFMGTFAIGGQINLPMIQFTVNAGSYTAGDSWEFVTYNYNGTINLDEPSIVTIEEANMDLTVVGGV